MWRQHGDVVGRRAALLRRTPRTTSSASRVENELLPRPRVHVVGQRGGRTDRVQLRHPGGTRHRRVLVPDVTHHVAAEIGAIRTGRATEPLQLLKQQQQLEINMHHLRGAMQYRQAP